MSAAGDGWVPGNRWDLLDGVWPAVAPTISVVVLHYEQRDALRRTLAALDAQTHPEGRTEVIVVDDGSARAPQVPPGTTLVRLADAGIRVGRARNVGATRAAGEVLCFLDADTAPEPEYLSRLSRLPALIGDAVTVGRRRHGVYDGDEGGAVPRRELPEPGWLRDGYAATGDLLNADERSYRYVIGAVLAVGRRFFDEVGPFADFDAYGGEDWEWAHRAWRNGAVLAHVPDAVAWHDGPDFAGRDDAARRRGAKNREALRLSGLIGVGGSRGHAIRPRRAEVVVVVEGSPSAAAAFICVDSLLAAFPDAAVVLECVDDALREALSGDPRVGVGGPPDSVSVAGPSLTIDVHRASAVDAAALRALRAEVTRDRLVCLGLADDAGPLLTLGDARARAQARRRGDADAPPEVRSADEIAVALPDEPDVEAWVGGWGGSWLGDPPTGNVPR